MKKCSIPDCQQSYSCKGMCKYHYEKNRIAENQDQENEKKRTYYYANKERILANMAIYRAKYPEKKKLNDAKWYDDNKDKVKKYREANKEKIVSDLARWKCSNPDYNRDWYIANRDAQLTANKLRYLSDKDGALKRLQEWRKNNPDKYKEQQRIYHAKTREKSMAYRLKNLETIKLYGRLYAKNNPEKFNAHRAKRRAAKRKATPAWANAAKIEEFYYTAQMLGMHTGELYHVDHIVPLRSKIVCGLHCEANLQILEASHNISKGNRHWPDMP